MRQFLKRYRIELTTKAPVFIGSGQTLTKKEYLFASNEKKVYVPDQAKLFSYLMENNLLDSYEAFLLNPYMKFQDWIREQQILAQEWKFFMRYAIDSGDAVRDDFAQKGIQLCMKDAYGQPYIPGSSLKGALRTAILTKRMQENPIKHREAQRQWMETSLRGRGSMGRESKAVEKSLLGIASEQEVIDSLIGLRISDSTPLEQNSLILCSKNDEPLYPRNNRYDGSAVQGAKLLIRECIKPGITIGFDMTLDSTYATITDTDIMQGIATFGRIYYECFSGKFGRKLPPQNTLYLGGGVGYVSKTLTYPILGKEGVKRTSELIDVTLSFNIKNQHKHHLDTQKGVSPHIIKTTALHQQVYDMGMCLVNLFEC